MMTAREIVSIINSEKGISAVIIAVCLVMLIGFIALSIDVSHLVVARNELQNAADAGALAGAAELYTDDGQSVDTDANQIGFDAAVANFSEQSPVEVNWTGGNVGDVQRGHWSFGLGSLPRGFTPNDSTAPVALWGVTTAELDENPNFINAVRVRTRRQNTPIASWFARIFGRESFEGFAEAVAYIGFAGTLKTETANAPIAICKEAITKNCDPDNPDDCEWDCSEGRFINDAAGKEDQETGYWTNMTQNIDKSVDPPADICSGGANANEVKPLVNCSAMATDFGVNDDDLTFGYNMEVNNGQIDAAFNVFYNCWKNTFEPDPGYLVLTLPVIKCADDPTTCAPLWGAVTVTVIHVTSQPNYKDLPETKNIPNWVNGPWDKDVASSNCSTDQNPDECVWTKFVEHFQLKDQYGNDAGYHAKSMYFLQTCEAQKAMGITGGPNYGILAEIPVLVR
jgi:hypothetical protein